VWIFYRNYCFSLEGKLEGGREGGKLKRIEVSRPAPGETIQRWPALGPHLSRPGNVARGGYDPTALLKDVMFHESIDRGANQRNRGLHRLDLSWRLQEFNSPLREIIVFGRVMPAAGAAEEILQAPSLPTLLWLGDLPGPGKSRPALAGNMVQDTYFRFILPVRPAD
jgi:hypothetical protein